MANLIEAITQFLPIIDEQYQWESKTSMFDTADALIRETREAKKFKLATISVDGLANYNRSTGFVAGDTDLTWTEYEYKIDRGRSFQVDHQENAEALSLAFAALIGTFNRTKVVPEIDAYRISQYASKAGVTSAVTLTEANVLGEIDKIIVVQDDAEVPESGKGILVTPEVYNLITNSTSLTRFLNVETVSRDMGGKTINKKVYSYNDMPIIKVPSNRMYTEITLLTADAGGYTASATADQVQLMIVSRDAVFQHSKRKISRIWAPTIELAAGTSGVNPNADAWKVDFRVYHDAWVLANKTKGVAIITKDII